VIFPERDSDRGREAEHSAAGSGTAQ